MKRTTFTLALLGLIGFTSCEKLEVLTPEKPPISDSVRLALDIMLMGKGTVQISGFIGDLSLQQVVEFVNPGVSSIEMTVHKNATGYVSFHTMAPYKATFSIKNYTLRTQSTSTLDIYASVYLNASNKPQP